MKGDSASLAEDLPGAVAAARAGGSGKEAMIVGFYVCKNEDASVMLVSVKTCEHQEEK